MLTQDTINQAILNNKEVLDAVAKAVSGTSLELEEFLLKTGQSAVIINIDGGSRGNPGVAGSGVAVRVNGAATGYYYYLGVQTNNYAEYRALEAALKLVVDNNYDEVMIYSDSELVCKQIHGEYKVKNPNIKPLFDECKSLLQRCKKVELQHVRREFNKDADKLANMAMDKKADGKVELTVAP